MIEPPAHRKKEASDHALATGGVPLDPYPGYLTWFVRACVESGAASGLDWLCRVCPEREIEILDAWCRRACEAGNRWAWQEARARLEGLVTGGVEVPSVLARFAIEPAPLMTRGPDPDGSRAVLIEFMVRVLQEGGFDAHEVNTQYGASFPSPGRHPGSALRKRRAKGRPYVAPAFEERGGAESDHHSVRRPVVLQYDWSDPVEGTRVLLTSGWPAFALIWEFWPEHRDAHLRLWCERAKSESWIWDELRALYDHAIYCVWTLPPFLRDFVSLPRPANLSNRPVKHGRWICTAAIEARLAQEVCSLPAARLFVLEAFATVRALRESGEHVESSSSSVPGSGLLGLYLDPSVVRKNFVSGREQLRGVIAHTLG